MSVDPVSQVATPTWVQNLDARMTKAVEHFDGLMNNLFSAVTEKMDGASAALVEKAGDMGASMARGANSLSASISPNSLSGSSKSDSSPSQEMAIEKSAGIPDHVKTQALAAVGGGGTGVGMPTIQASNMQSVDMSQQISPPVTYGVQQTQSQVLGIG